MTSVDLKSRKIAHQAPVPLYNGKQIKAIEQSWFEQGNSCFGLMQQAAWQIAQYIFNNYRDYKIKLPLTSRPRALIWAGTGNNGGDGWLTAYYLKQAGWQVYVIEVTDDKTNTAFKKPKSDADRARKLALSSGIAFGCFFEIIKSHKADHQDLPSVFVADIYIDAIFGIGLYHAPSKTLGQAIVMLNKSARQVGAQVVAIDTPSGLVASTGQVFDDVAVRADLTLCLIARKLGLHIKDGVDFYGQVVDLPLIPLALNPIATLLPKPDAIPKRRQNSHKGSFGHVLIIGGNQIDGSQGMGGAAILASASALAMGAGKLTTACHTAFHNALLGTLPDAMSMDLHDKDGVCELIQSADVIAIGMGLGRDEQAKSLFIHYINAAIDHHKPLIIDADGLYHLAHLYQDNHQIIKKLQAFSKSQSLMLTPHSAEAAKLLGISVGDVEADRVTSIYDCAARFGGTWVLKGAGSLILEDKLFVCGTGNSGMASAGMGDVLAGVIAGFLAQQDLASVPRPLAQAVLIHGLAGDVLVTIKSKPLFCAHQSGLGVGHRGLQAQDMPSAIRHVVDWLTVTD